VQANTKVANTYGHLQRALDAFEHCVVLLDTSDANGWKVIYANATLNRLTGRQRGEDLAPSACEEYGACTGPCWRLICYSLMMADLVLLHCPGYERKDVIGQQLEELFEDGNGKPLLSQEHREAVAKNKAFTVKLARTKKPTVDTKSGSLMLNFR
jgi:hypothetical protein